MESSQHNYAIIDSDNKKSVFSANSHACAYAYTSFQTGYLKANYPEEFICTLLTVESERAKFDKIFELERNFKKKMNIKILPRSLNDCKVDYTIESKKDESKGVLKTEIRPSLLCKGLGKKAAIELEKKQPYSGIRDIAERTSSSVVDAKVMASLAAGGYIQGNKGVKNVDKIVEEFKQIRADLKLIAKKGMQSIDIFA